MKVRSAAPDDAEGMSRVLKEIIAITGRERPSDPSYVISQYVNNPTGVRCSVAVDNDDRVLGFQSLIRSVPGNQYGVPEGWGIIGTHISPRAQRQGVGTALFACSKEAALIAGLKKIDAFIGSDNASGLSYYDAMGFRTYRQSASAIQKVFDLK